MATHYEKLLIYNHETNQIGWIPWLYNEHHMATAWTSITPNEPYKPPKSNLNFLAINDNKWCVVGTSALYRKVCYFVDNTSWTYPFIYYDTDDGRVYIGTSDKGTTVLQGRIRVSGNVVREKYTPGANDFTSETATFSSEKTNYGYTGYRTGSYKWTCSAPVDESTGASIMQDLSELFRVYANFYVTRAAKYGRNGCLPIAVKRDTYALGYNDRLYCSVIWPGTYQGHTLGANTCGPLVGYNFTTVNPSYDTGPSTLYDIECGSYEAYQSGTTYTALDRYITDFHNGEAPEDLGELSPSDLAGDNIYTPGGDTTDPHNPYPSGDSPYTSDPLDSGVETDSPDTDGTWKLPFDNVPDSPATVHSVNLGLYNAYALSGMQVMELANYLFSGITEIGENLVKLIWGSKRDVVISLIEFPLMITNQGVEEIRFIFDTELAGMFHGKQLTNEYLPIDFGTIEVPRYSGTFYDFEPYTTLTLYIPYIGYIDLKPTEVIGSTLSISGYVHLTTGEINVNVKSSRTGILGSYSGTIGRMLPIADADATEIYSAIIKTAASLGAVAVAGVGAASASSAAGAVSAPSHHAVDIAQSEYQNAIKDWGAATKGIRGKQAEMMNKGASYEAAVANYNEQRSKYNQVNKAADNAREDFHDALSEAGSNAIGAVTTGFNVTRGTVMTSSNGRLSPQRCFLRIEVPHQNVSRNQKILGYPANSSDSLNSNRLHGYTELRAIELSIPRATLTELQELENILKGGFYLP